MEWVSCALIFCLLLAAVWVKFRQRSYPDLINCEPSLSVSEREFHNLTQAEPTPATEQGLEPDEDFTDSSEEVAAAFISLPGNDEPMPSSLQDDLDSYLAAPERELAG
jgi:hypothetical protein